MKAHRDDEACTCPAFLGEFIHAIDQAEQSASNIMLPFEQAMAWAAIANAYGRLIPSDDMI